ncbi:hypothetical protein HK099_002138 [Clydaea vesicula]|uniref:Protein kinase domain-containing protein n=1 Tax=Clydaea vesicula TaxID=447962 RepID=A0AAD5Y1J8_9FUNG|nr:hypothetical protein HK099_002138 [Clydaea vesicula]
MSTSLEKRYKISKQLGDGSFGSVYLANNIENGEVVAIKQMKQKYTKWEDCLALREVRSLKKLNNHENIVKLKEVLREKDGTLAFVFEYMEGNLYQLIKQNEGVRFTEQKVKHIMDMKPENLLTKGDVLKIADFGLAREIRSQPPYTEYVSTRWYRAPEVILNQPNYSSPIDIWAVGAIMAEVFTLDPLFPGQSEIDQIHKICTVLGPPSSTESQSKPIGGMIGSSNSYYNQANTSNLNSKSLFGGGYWPEGVKLAKSMSFHFPNIEPPVLESIITGIPIWGLQLIADMLKYDPSKRPSAANCLQHPWFEDLISFLPEADEIKIEKKTFAQPTHINTSETASNNLYPTNSDSKIDSALCISLENEMKEFSENLKNNNTDEYHSHESFFDKSNLLTENYGQKSAASLPFSTPYIRKSLTVLTQVNEFPKSTTIENAENILNSSVSLEQKVDRNEFVKSSSNPNLGYLQDMNKKSNSFTSKTYQPLPSIFNTTISDDKDNENNEKIETYIHQLDNFNKNGPRNSNMDNFNNIQLKTQDFLNSTSILEKTGPRVACIPLEKKSSILDPFYQNVSNQKNHLNKVIPPDNHNLVSQRNLSLGQNGYATLKNEIPTSKPMSLGKKLKPKLNSLNFTSNRALHGDSKHFYENNRGLMGDLQVKGSSFQSNHDLRKPNFNLPPAYHQYQNQNHLNTLQGNRERHQDLLKGARERFRGPTWPLVNFGGLGNRSNC